MTGWALLYVPVIKVKVNDTVASGLGHVGKVTSAVHAAIIAQFRKVSPLRTVDLGQCARNLKKWLQG